MNVVDACNKEQINQVSETLIQRYPSIYNDVWRIGLNLTLRIGDLLAIKHVDLDMKNRTLKLRESKTGKTKHIRLNQVVIDIATRRKIEHPGDVWLFQAHNTRTCTQPVTRGSVSRVFKEAGDWLGLTINTHSMRKSRGKAMFDDGLPLELIAKTLNHSSTTETLRYIGITKERVLQTFDDYQL